MGPRQSAWDTQQTEHFAPFVLLGLFAVLGALIFRPGIVNYDGSAHYAYVRSAVIDGDFDFSNDIVPADWPPRTETGRVANFAPIGAAIAWTPWFVAAHGVCQISAVFASYCRDGFGWLYVTAISLGTALYGLAGLLVVQRAARRFAPPAAAWAATLAIWLGSPLLAYMYVVPSMPHAISFAATSAFLACWWPARERCSVPVWFGWGLVGGLAALVRWQSAIWLVLPVWTLLTAGGPLTARARAAAAFACAFIILFSPQMAAWVILFGKALTIPQGSGFLDWTRPAVADVLLSPLHGLFAWMPLALVACVGLAGMAIARRQVGLPLVLIVALYIYINGIAGDWWGGGAFGPRRFIDVFPALILGMAVTFAWARSRRLWFYLLVAATALCIAGQWLFMAEFFSARVLPEQPLTWLDALSRMSALGPEQWLIMPTVVGQWHMGPYGTPASSLAFLLVFATSGLVLRRFVSWPRWNASHLRKLSLLALFCSVAIDFFIFSLR